MAKKVNEAVSNNIQEFEDFQQNGRYPGVVKHIRTLKNKLGYNLIEKVIEAKTRQVFYLHGGAYSNNLLIVYDAEDDLLTVFVGTFRNQPEPIEIQMDRNRVFKGRVLTNDGIDFIFKSIGIL